MKILRKAFILVCAFISTFMIASTSVLADAIYDEPISPIGMDIIVDPYEEVVSLIVELLPPVIIVIVLIITAVLVRVFLKKKKKDSEKNEKENDKESENV